MTREEQLKELTKLGDQELQHWKSIAIIRDKRNLLLGVEVQHGKKAEAAAENRKQREADANQAAAQRTTEKMEKKSIMDHIDTEGAEKAGVMLEARMAAENRDDDQEDVVDDTMTAQEVTREDGKSKCFACSKWFVNLPKHKKSCSYLKKLEEGPDSEEQDGLDPEKVEDKPAELDEISVKELSNLFAKYAQLSSREQALKVLDDYGVKSVSKMSDDQRVEAAVKIKEMMSLMGESK